MTPEFNGNLSSLPSKVEWRDAKGKVLKTCELDQSKSIKSQVAACTFDIPEDAKKGDYFNVVLVSGGNDVSAWTVLVTKDSDEYTPAYEDKLVVPGEETKSSPTFTDKDGKDTEAPEGSKFSIPEDFTAPEGYEVKIDENTGEITVTFPDKSKLNKDTVEEFDVPVTVTYPDGSTDEAPAKFKLDTDGDGDPDVTDPDDDNDGVPDEDDSNPKVPNQNTIYEPAYEEKLVVPGEETKSSPKFTDKDGKDATVPEGSKFSIPEDFKAPEGYVVEIDPNTGEITVTFPDKSKLNKDTVEEFDVPVTVTYPDGTKDEAPAKFKLDTDGDGKPDTEDEDDDNDGVPDGDDSNPKVPNQNTVYEPGYEDGSGKPGDDVTIDQPEFKDKDGNPTTVPDGTKFTPGDGAPDGVTIDENTGEITVTIPEDAEPGTKITVPVEVTYPDGSKDNVDVTVTVEEPDTPAEKPDWKDDSGKPGDKVEIPNTGGDVPEGSTVETEGPGKAEIDENGNLVVDIDKDAKPGEKIVVIVKDKDGNEIDRVVVEVEDPGTPAAKPDWNDNSGKPGDKVEIPNDGGPVDDGTTVETEGPGKAEIDEDGKITVDIDDDAKPGDKVVVIVKDKDGNEIDRVVVEVEDPGTPAAKPDWNDNSGKPGDNVVIPNDGGPVPDGSTVETEGPGKATIDENGNIRVDIDDDAKPGDKIVVTVKDKDGNVIDRVTVTVDKPAEEPAPEGNGNVPAKPGDNTGAPRGKQPVKVVPLPRTGAEIASAAGAAAALIAAGLGLVFSRRRREGEEN